MNKTKVFKATIWAGGPDEPGKRVSVQADSLQKAREMLEARYGVGAVFDLHNPDDAARPR